MKNNVPILFYIIYIIIYIYVYIYIYIYMCVCAIISASAMKPAPLHSLPWCPVPWGPPPAPWCRPPLAALSLATSGRTPPGAAAPGGGQPESHDENRGKWCLFLGPHGSSHDDYTYPIGNQINFVYEIDIINIQHDKKYIQYSLCNTMTQRCSHISTYGQCIAWE